MKGKLMSESIILSAGNFKQEVLESEIPVLVDYWAGWCGPCRMLGPVIKEIAQESKGSLRVGKVDVDAEPELAARAGAVSIPYVVLYRDGKPVAHAIGAMPKQRLKEALGLADELDRVA
jgi:thioredoxin 1